MAAKMFYTVVVADDEEELREAVCTMIPWQDYGFQMVGSASNGLDALQMVEQHEPDLLITDIQMPFISGIELARQVRRLRKDYQEKGALMERLLLEAFGKDISVSRVVSGVYCHIALQSPYDESELRRRAEERGCRVLAMQSFYERPEQADTKEFLLSFSKIPSQDLKQAVAALHRAWTEKEG